MPVILRSLRSSRRLPCSASGRSANTRETKARRLPSSNHFGLCTPLASFVSRRASPPPSGITYNCGALSSPRCDVKATYLPSGLIAGEPSLAASVVNARWPLPSTFQIHRSEYALSSSIANRVTGATIVRPSRDTVGAPMRCSFQLRSTVNGSFFACAIAADCVPTQTSANNATAMFRTTMTASGNRVFVSATVAARAPTA